MSVMVLDGWRNRNRHWHVGSWATSLALHGLLGGVIVWFAVLVQPPVMLEIEAPFRWDVALTSAATPVSASAAKVSAAQPAQAPRTTPVPAPAASVISVPVAEVAPLPASPINTTALSQPSPPVKEQGVAEQVSAPASPASIAAASSVVSAPVSAAVDNTGGELADLLWRRMEALKRYPYLARRNGWEGKVLIRVVLGGDGRLLHAEIQKSSGHEVLDQDALKVLRAATLPTIEPNLSWQQQATFTLPVAYRLQ